MSWVSPQDIVDRWVGQDVPTDEDLVQALINDAETIVLATYPRIQERLDSGVLKLDVIKLVVARMAGRVLRNPENLTYWQQNVGPYGQGKNYGSGNTDIWMTDDEKDLLSPKKSGKAFDTNLAPQARAPRHSVWIEVDCE